VDTNQQPLSPVHPARARKLLAAGKAAVYRRYPFVIRLKVAISDPVVAELRVKLDPGSKTTGIAVVNDQSGAVVFAAELIARGHQIRESLDSRRAIAKLDSTIGEGQTAGSHHLCKVALPTSSLGCRD
jgi:hypothetical protein